MSFYSLDAETFREAKKRYDRIKICPGYRGWLLVNGGTKEVRSIDRIAHESSKDTDDLSAWAAAHPELFYTTTDAETQGHFAAAANPVAGLPDMTPGAIPSFLSGADPRLIASAPHTGATIVTHEVLGPEIHRNFKFQTSASVSTCRASPPSTSSTRYTFSGRFLRNAGTIVRRSPSRPRDVGEAEHDTPA